MADTSGSGRVVSTCEEKWDAHKCDCSGFVKAVASELGITLNGMANDIVDEIQGEPWVVIQNGLEARQKAEDGLFVVAGMKEAGHGHVVVITPGPLAHDRYPTGYWGRLGSVGKKDSTINWAWNEQDRDHLVYAYRSF